MGWHNPPEPWRDLARRLAWEPEDARQAQRAGDVPVRPVPDPVPAPDDAVAGTAATPPTPAGPAWAELHCHSSYSFLDGCSDPETLVTEARRLGVEVLGLTDHDGMYGVVRMVEAARGSGLRTAFGAELNLGLDVPRTGVPDPAGQHLLVLARGPEGYRRLCREISAAQLAGGQKGRPVYDLDALAATGKGHWAVLTGCRKGAVPAALESGGPGAAAAALRGLVDRFGRDGVYVELTDHDLPGDDARNDVLYALAGEVGVGVVASNNVHYAGPSEAELAAAVAAVRARQNLDEMVGHLPVARTAHLRSGAEMAARLARFPGVQEATVALAHACAFDFAELAPRLPLYRDLKEGETEDSHLRERVREGAREKYGPREAETQAGAWAQLDHELEVITTGGYSGYFLIVHEIVAWCREEGILVQGRGSAANSAVCYALGITKVDAVRHGLLFERFLSPGRDGPPDIDLDIENARREEVIQHVYARYGRDRAAQVANVITYRPRMAVRDAAKALGHSPGQRDAWARQIGLGDVTPEESGIPAPVAALADRFRRLPRHLGIHSGGMVICESPVSELVPVEWAQMENRSVVQWDKDDCAAVNLIKFDLLGLGMLSALRDAFALLLEHCGIRYDLDTVPREDPRTYEMLRDADTIGVFQVESRAQMATLPRLRPKEFYDLVVEVSLVRPGPIQGGSVHPYLRRRHGLEPVTYPHPLMEKALAKTYGVPLFQEQMMQIAVDCAGFDPAEADRLRQAMSSKRSVERIAELRVRLLAGMAAKGIAAETAEDIYHKLLGFAGFGFPESHAISFAYLVYASAYLKRHHPAVFTAALLRNQPMGFYGAHTLVGDARRHGVTVRGVDVNASEADANLEPAEPPALPASGRAHPHAPGTPQPAIRLGLATVRNLGKEQAEAIAAGRPYDGLEDLVRRVRLPVPALEALATAGAFGCFGLTRREALWAAGGSAGVRADQLDGSTPGLPAPELPLMTPVEETFADLWATGSSATTHPVQHLRADLTARGVVPASALPDIPSGRTVRTAGVVTHRQRPGTASGTIFLNLEDETGLVNVICSPGAWVRYRRVALNSPALLVAGRLERADGAINLLAHRIETLQLATVTRSRDFR